MAGEFTRWRNKIPMKEKINEYIIPGLCNWCI